MIYKVFDPSVRTLCYSYKCLRNYYTLIEDFTSVQVYLQKIEVFNAVRMEREWSESRDMPIDWTMSAPKEWQKSQVLASDDSSKRILKNIFLNYSKKC